MSRKTSAKNHPALEAIRLSGANKVKVAVSDIGGVLRGKYLHKDKFLSAAEPYPPVALGFAMWCWAGTCLMPAMTTRRPPAGSTVFPMRWPGST